MLVVEVHAKNEIRSFEFDQSVITIGRADVNDIVLPTAKVSKRHARLEATAQGIILTDIKSTNGTYLNGRKVLAPALLGDTDRVHIGEFVITVQVAELPVADPQAPLAAAAPLAVHAVPLGDDVGDVLTCCLYLCHDRHGTTSSAVEVKA